MDAGAIETSDANDGFTTIEGTLPYLAQLLESFDAVFKGGVLDPGVGQVF